MSSTPIISHPSPLDFGLHSPPINAHRDAARPRRLTRRLFSLHTALSANNIMSPAASTRASPYADILSGPPFVSLDGDVVRTPLAARSSLVGAEISIERERLEFLMNENRRLRTQLLNTVNDLNAQIEAWENRLLQFELAELERQANAQRRRQTAVGGSGSLLDAALKSPLGTSPVVPPAPAAQVESTAAADEDDDIYLIE
jgi:TolA-binding protein